MDWCNVYEGRLSRLAYVLYRMIDRIGLLLTMALALQLHVSCIALRAELSFKYPRYRLESGRLGRGRRIS